MTDEQAAQFQVTLASIEERLARLEKLIEQIALGMGIRWERR